MSDEFAVQQTLSTYSICVTLGDLEGMANTFMPDGLWEIPGIEARFEGREAIRTGAKGLVAALDTMVQQNSPAVIKVDGDTATARSVIRECGSYADHQASIEVLGVYEDELQRTPDGWKFKSRHFKLLAMHDFETAPPALGG